MYASSPACPYLMCECFLHQSCYQTDFNKSLLLSSFYSNKLNIWDHKHNINFICGSLCRQSGCWWLFSEGLFLLFLLICLWFGTYAKCSSLKSQLVSPWYPVWPYYLPPLSILGTDLVSFRGNSVQLLPSQGFQHIPSKRNFTRLHQNCLAWSSCVENPYSFTNCYHHTLSRFPQYWLLGNLDQSCPLTLSFRFWVCPCKHLYWHGKYHTNLRAAPFLPSSIFMETATSAIEWPSISTMLSSPSL